MFTPQEIKAAQVCVYASLRPTPQFEWQCACSGAGGIAFKPFGHVAGVLTASFAI